MEQGSADDDRKAEIQRLLDEMRNSNRIFKIALFIYILINLVGGTILWLKWPSLDAGARLQCNLSVLSFALGWIFFQAIFNKRTTRRQLRELEGLRAAAGKPGMP